MRPLEMEPIKAQREALGVSMPDFANKIGVKTNTYRSWESRGKCPNPQMYSEVIKALRYFEGVAPAPLTEPLPPPPPVDEHIVERTKANLCPKCNRGIAVNMPVIKFMQHIFECGERAIQFRCGRCGYEWQIDFRIDIVGTG